ncbi:hypothetical protein KTD19_27945 [Burkholderia multivorans]|uniref:hypothetical protein n=1 Tax=Burkholderia multivorans TaxID=87883 RepID=UPI001C22A576|nr:hypothetical protein [Burkholderia multivorans]MBU9236211.1 hypothetical protein [Burkholderia multivorans]
MPRSWRAEEHLAYDEYMFLGPKDVTIKLLEKKLEVTKKCLADALAERSSCTPEALEVQLHEMSMAVRALARFEFMGGSKETETYRILDANYKQQKARLQFMVHDTIDMSEEVAKARVDAYIAQQEAMF